MNLAILSTYPPRKCGIGLYTKRLAHALSKHCAVKVFSFKNFDYRDKKVLPLLEKNNLFSYFKLAEMIKKQNFERVLIEYEYIFYNPFFFIMFLFMLKLKNIRVYLEMHTVVPYDDFIKKSVFMLYHSAMLIFVDAVILHTKLAEKKLMDKSLVKSSIITIPMPILVKKTKIRKSRNKNIILTCFGFISIDKGFDMAIDAFGGLKGVILQIIGTVNPTSMKKQHRYYDEIKERAKKFDNVRIIDRFVSDKEKDYLFKETDFFILPYRFIEQSAILMDVWSYHKIPLCSDIDYFKHEINDKYGILFKSGDCSDLRKKFIDVRDDKRRQKIIIENIRKSIRRRNFENYSTAILSKLA